MRCKLQAWGLFALDAQVLEGIVSACAANASLVGFLRAIISGSKR